MKTGTDPRGPDQKPRVLWELSNMSYESLVINDFVDDSEAIQYAANLEAKLWRLDPEAGRVLLYDPAESP